MIAAGPVGKEAKREVKKTILLNDLFDSRHQQEQAIAAGDAQGYKKATLAFKNTHGKLQQLGALSAPRKGFTDLASRFVSNIKDAAVYAPYGLYKGAEAVAKDEYYGLQGDVKHSQHTTDLLKAMGKSTVEDIRHPLRNPGYTALDALALLSAGAGTASRIGAAGEAARAASATGEGATAWSRAAKAALTRPSSKGGSLLHRPAPGETSLVWRGALNEDRQLKIGEMAGNKPEAVHIQRLQPDNPLLRPIHNWRNSVLQKQLDHIAAGGKLSDNNIAVATRHLLGMDAPTVVGREARALRRVAPDMADTVEANIPKEWIKKLKAGPRGASIQKLREFTNQVRFFGVYLGPKYVTTNVLGNTMMGVSTQGVAKIAANMYRAHRMPVTHGAELTRLIDHEAGITRTESYLPEALKGEATLTHRGGLRGFQDRYTNKMMDWTDRDFRRASWQYRAREKGFNTVAQQNKLIKDPKLAETRAAIARRARKDAVDFDSLTPAEKHLTEVVFFYPWMSRASLWTGRTVFNRPLKSALVTKLAQQGQAASQRELGKQPEWMQGYVKTPWGVINPKSVLAPSTVGDEIVQGKHVVKGALGLEKGNVRSAFQEFGTPPFEVLSGGMTLPQLAQTLLPVSTYVRAGSPLGQIPGTKNPKTFPKTGIKEALLPTILGGLFPRQADPTVYHEQAKREEMLATSPMQHIGMRTDERMSKIPAQVKMLAKKGLQVSQSDIASYKGDLDALKHRDEFRLKYAQGKGKSAYRDLDPLDKANAALEYLQKYSHLDTASVTEYQNEFKGASKSDQAYYANVLWGETGIGQVKANWDANVRMAGG